MTQAEKDKLHIKNQNRRARKLLLDILMPLLLIQIFAAPMLAMGIQFLCVKPSEPVEVTFSECKWQGYGRNKSLVLYTQEKNEWMIPHHLREAFYPDVESGAVLPGDRLTVRWYPWMVRDAAATIAGGDKIYGSLEGWQISQKKDACGLFVFSGLLNLAGAAFSVWMWYGTRAEYSEIRRLRRKYRERIRQKKP
jgi:hypothetical protein